MNSNTRKVVSIALGSALLLGGFAAVAQADHAWGNYHWGRTANTFTLELGDNVSNKWDAYLSQTSSDWSLSSVVTTVVANGKAKRNCRATDGRVEVCSASYGATGWLGIAQIWISGDHITKGVVKVNDTYFDTTAYNTPAWRDLVMCQEVGHTLGLGHNDEDVTNTPTGTCMDYSSDPTPNRHPDGHDYDMLGIMYGHLDSVDTVKSTDDGGGGGNGKGNGKGKSGKVGKNTDLNSPSEWGQSVRSDAQGNRSLFVRNLGNGEKVVTFVTWIEGTEGK